MEKILEDAVRERSQNICEYCHAPELLYRERFQIDHIIARQHRGETTSENLCLCCLDCNLRKGPNIASIDPETKQLVPLFNPRTDIWNDHFVWHGARLVGLTAIGRATVALLDINRDLRVAVRHSHLQEGLFPPAADYRK